MPGQFQLGILHVDGNDPPCPRQCRTVDGGQADTATADHRHRLTRTHLGSVEYRPRAGGYRATEQGRTVQRHVAADRNQGMLVHQHLFGVSRQVDELGHRLLHVGQARLFVLTTLGVWRHAQRQVTGHAVFAMAAVGRQAGDDMVTRLDRAHQFADLLDNPRSLVAEHHRCRVWIVTVDKVQVGVANTDGDSTHQHFVRAGFADPHLFDGQG
ncbi:hypothetical protein D3C78_967350 [compost metagenome]